MKKRITLLVGAVLSVSIIKARRQSDSKLLTEFNKQRLRTTTLGMLVLGSWAVSNFAVSGSSFSNLKDSQHYFHQMNLLWNVVNVALAGIGYYQATEKKARSASLSQTVNDYYSLRRKLLFNAGLDTAYVVGGFYLLEKAKNELNRSEQWQGYGRSLVLQGTFLLAFDFVLYLVIRSQAKSLNNIMGKISFNN